jgi:hypothetical protein
MRAARPRPMWGQPPSAVRRPRSIGPQQTPPPPHFHLHPEPSPSMDVIPTREGSETGGIRCERTAPKGDAPFFASFARKPALSLPKGGIHRRHLHRILISKPTDRPHPKPLSFRRASAARQEESDVSQERMKAGAPSLPRSYRRNLSCSQVAGWGF